MHSRTPHSIARMLTTSHDRPLPRWQATIILRNTSELSAIQSHTSCFNEGQLHTALRPVSISCIAYHSGDIIPSPRQQVNSSKTQRIQMSASVTVHWAFLIVSCNTTVGSSRCFTPRENLCGSFEGISNVKGVKFSYSCAPTQFDPGRCQNTSVDVIGCNTDSIGLHGRRLVYNRPLLLYEPYANESSQIRPFLAGRSQFDSDHHQSRRLSSHSYSHESVIFLVFFGLIVIKLRRVCVF